MSNYNRAINDNDLRWEDQQVQLGAIKLPGVSDPSWVAYKGAYILSFSKSADNIISFTAQLSHSYLLESDLEFHIHCAYPDGNSGNSIWNFTYSWADIDSVFNSETSVSDVVIASPETQDQHTLHEIIGSISGTGKVGVSSMLLCSLQREGSHVNDTYNNDIYMIGLDFHYKKDDNGSQTELIK